MIRDIDMSLLRAFSTVVETGSVTAAARLLNRTQAAVSLQIKRLEEQFDKALFEREHRRLRLTPAGERLVAAAQRMVALNDELFGQMTTPDFAGEVRFGVPTDIVPIYIPPILRRFNQTWPRVRVTLQTGNSFHLLEAMKRGEIDLTLTTDAERDPRAEILRVDQLRWVGAPGGHAHLTNPLPLAVGDHSCRFRPVVIDALRKAERDWRMVLEVSSQVAQDAAVSAGIAVTASLRDSVPESLQVLDDSASLPALPEFFINMHAPKAGHNAIADELARHIRQEFNARFGAAAALPAPKRARAKVA
jgi:DNA-binding transcriptional LysR family regulator